MSGPIALTDLRRKAALVDMGEGQQLAIQGLTAAEICDHLETFPILRTISIGGTMSPMDAITGSPGALAAWVASACGAHRDPEAEEIVATQMTIEQSSEIAEASLALTFSKGFGPFSGRLAALLGFLSVGRGAAPATRSPPPSPRSSSPAPASPGPGASRPDSSQPISSSSNENASSEPLTS